MKRERRLGPFVAVDRFVAETVAAATLALSAIYILFNETLADWQAVWFALALIVLAVTLVPVRGAPDSK